ncbi:Heme peroxidase, plant/fungal/bacterial [Corchorus olitorius]|uniref:peroxidase n=1 Tax=Corchorus olitorius TaxID=93759 RepID=A0A1R3J722_9ROSI|nr:Heme peroxidase, plant/fungal/bacterial [Corchorus olitorius]
MPNLQSVFPGILIRQYMSVYKKNLKLRELLKVKVHMEADRKARSGETNNNMPTSHFEERITYRVGNKAYVDRREQVRLIKEFKVTISLRYADLVSVLPTRVKVLAWPMHQFKKNHTSSAILSKNENGTMNSHPIPARLSYAEDALRTMSLPEGMKDVLGMSNHLGYGRFAVKQKFQQTFVTAPATLRLFFHDCFVRGCDASVMLASWNNTAEKDNPDNLSLAGDGFDTVIKAKAAVDSVPECRNKVSCADILAMATRDVITLTGGPFYAVELGRLDGRMSTKASVRHHLPGPDFKLGKLKAMFASHGLSLTDLVALSGAHTIGFSHCSRFARRIYKFKSKTGIDPTLDQAYARQLRQMCPENVDSRMAIEMDSATPRTFDNLYYKNLQQGKGLFTSDQSLFTDDAMSRNIVNMFASNNTAFEEAFVIAITKLGRLRVRTGKHGEIRHDCAVVNKI